MNANNCAVCPSGVVVQKEKEPPMSSLRSRPKKVFKNDHLWIISELMINSTPSMTTRASGEEVQLQDWKVGVKHLISHWCLRTGLRHLTVLG